MPLEVPLAAGCSHIAPAGRGRALGDRHRWSGMNTSPPKRPVNKIKFLLLGNIQQQANKSIMFIQIRVKRSPLLSKELCQPEILSHFTIVKVFYIVK